MLLTYSVVLFITVIKGEDFFDGSNEFIKGIGFSQTRIKFYHLLGENDYMQVSICHVFFHFVYLFILFLCFSLDNLYVMYE